jgi:hypothetical protein
MKVAGSEFGAKALATRIAIRWSSLIPSRGPKGHSPGGCDGGVADSSAVAAPQGLRHVDRLAGAIEEDSPALPELARSILQLVVAQLNDTQAKVRQIEAAFWCCARSNNAFASPIAWPPASKTRVRPNRSHTACRHHPFSTADDLGRLRRR